MKKREKEDRMQRAKDEDFDPDAFDDDEMVTRKREKTPASAGKKRGRKAKV